MSQAAIRKGDRIFTKGKLQEHLQHLEGKEGLVRSVNDKFAIVFFQIGGN